MNFDTFRWYIQNLGWLGWKLDETERKELKNLQEALEYLVKQAERRTEQENLVKAEEEKLAEVK